MSERPLKLPFDRQKRREHEATISELTARIAELEQANAELLAELNMFREKLSNFSQEQFDRANHLDM